MAISKLGVVFFVQYVFLFVALAILVKLSHRSGTYSYNTTLVVFVVELLKLSVASAMAVYTYSWSNLVSALRFNGKLLLLYCVPALLYSFHNNLMFFSMSHLDPATYYVLLQFRVIVTGVLFQFLFRRALSRAQWLALCILFCGCLLKEVDRNVSTPAAGGPAATQSARSAGSRWVVLVVLVQVVCSCGAAVYTEYLLKSAAEKANVHLQNMFMYLDSIACNAAVLVIRAGLRSGAEPAAAIVGPGDFYNLLQPVVLAIIAVSAAGGLTTAFLLKHLDSVLKVYANSFEIVLTAIFSYVLLGVRISALSYVALFSVCASLYLYRRASLLEEGPQKGGAAMQQSVAGSSSSSGNAGSPGEASV